MAYNYDPRYRGEFDSRDVFDETPEAQEKFRLKLNYMRTIYGPQIAKKRPARPEIRHSDGSVTREDVNQLTGGMAGYTRTFPDGHREMVNTPQAVTLSGENHLSGDHS